MLLIVNPFRDLNLTNTEAIRKYRPAGSSQFCAKTEGGLLERNAVADWKTAYCKPVWQKEEAKRGSF